MSAPIALGSSFTPPSPPESTAGHRAKTLTARDAPTSPGKRLPVVDKSKVDPQTLQAAEGMEAMFLDYMMRVMRETVPKNDMDLESPATKIYQGMMDSETAQKAARAGGVGLADQIVAYLEAQRYTGKAGHGAQQQPDSTGGTHAGQPKRK